MPRTVRPATKDFRKSLANSFEGICGAPVITLPPLCRPAGWVALWRRIGTVSVLDAKSELSS
jgi:hypothetical protein